MTAFVRQSNAEPAKTPSAIPLLHLCSHRSGRNRQEIRFIFHACWYITHSVCNSNQVCNSYRVAASSHAPVVMKAVLLLLTDKGENQPMPTASANSFYLHP